MINTINESSLHKTLKTLYSLDNGSKTEIAVGQWICDILKPDKQIIEIQISNVSALLPKIKGLLSAGYRITVVHPIIRTKYIEVTEKTGNTVSRRKSPKQESIYSIFKELTGLYSVILHDGFTLEVPEIVITERRIMTDAPIQLPNRSRHFLRSWIKADKKLDLIIKTNFFRTASDYLALLPFSADQEFSTYDTTELLKTNSSLPRSATRQAGVMLWVLSRMKLIEYTTIKARRKYYKLRIEKSPTPTQASGYGVL